eukprot:CAMPEP_0170958820 /NCGR_PEP_ID=MMETSP0735-20130129/35929_1 /TAXON_ID=186038 /ORGANISM="Fragilariopsis kerguelensis, Strain L26-C5" /LENGTH=147 /DNA_ID=CAMNT_0011372809 /DNA_START=310 /DNA_END=753 /DNA_ORIENTATION=-
MNSMIGRRRERTGCCSTRSRNHHLNHATILIQEHRHQALALRRQYNSNDLNSRASLGMILEEEGEEEEHQLMKYKYDDDDDDDTITTANTTSSSVSSSPSSISTSFSSLASSSSSFSPPSTIPILSGTDFYWQSQRKSQLSSLAYYY